MEEQPSDVWRTFDRLEAQCTPLIMRMARLQMMGQGGGIAFKQAVADKNHCYRTTVCPIAVAKLDECLEMSANGPLACEALRVEAETCDALFWAQQVLNPSALSGMKRIATALEPQCVEPAQTLTKCLQHAPEESQPACRGETLQLSLCLGRGLSPDAAAAWDECRNSTPESLRDTACAPQREVLASQWNVVARQALRSMGFAEHELGSEDTGALMARVGEMAQWRFRE